MLSEEQIREMVRRVLVQQLGAAGGPAAPSSQTTREEGTAQPAPAAPRPAAGGKTLALGSDHGGFELKEKLKPYLYELGWTVDDCGTFSNAAVDYPTLALAVAQKVGAGQVARGIMIDGAGIGSCMTANKVPGVRASLCYDPMTARNAREHNDANVLTLGGQLLGIATAREIVRIWLSTECKEERHLKRVALITDIERRFSGGAR